MADIVPAMDDHVGLAILARRKALGLTLEVLARGSGVSRAMLSDVERGRRSPTVKILAQIAVGLGCRTADLLAGPEPERVFVERASQHPRVLDESTGTERVTLPSPLLRRGLELVRYVLPAGVTMRRSPLGVSYEPPGGRASGRFPPNPRGSIEHVVVDAGRLLVTLRGDAWRLGPGDVVHYRLVDEVSLLALGTRACRLSLVLDTHLSNPE